MDTTQLFTWGLSGAAFALSAFTAWFSLLRRGTVKMTHPRLVYFGWESSRQGYRPKIFLRSLLFSTGKRGQIIQSMYLLVTRPGGHDAAVFSTWAYGERNNLSPGSGLFVGEAGIGVNHHFLLLTPGLNSDRFGFTSGYYQIKVYADILGLSEHIQLGEASIDLSAECAQKLQNYLYGVLFEWQPDARTFVSEVDEPPSAQLLAVPPLRPGL